MKKLFLIPLLIGCSHDCPDFDPCDCLLIVDPVSFQSTNENGTITYNTYFVGKNECLNISEPMNFETTVINQVPKKNTCFKN